MINDYVIKLIDNLPDDIKNVKEPIIIDLVLDGGIFNGSYLVGALYFLKEMEKRNYIKIDRISGCSIGSIVAFLYFIDGLDIMSQLYEIVNKDFRETYKLTIIKEIKKHLGDHIPKDICQKINNKLYLRIVYLEYIIIMLSSKLKNIIYPKPIPDLNNYTNTNEALH